ncbi:MAG TPA: FAD-dependent oxidoreductase [Myxococcota bacterium]
MATSRGGGRATLVLGAGISGLAAARRLLQAGHRPLVLEAGPAAGGLTRSIEIGDFVFDYTGHLLHLARHAAPSELPLADLRDAEWQRIERRSLCLVEGRLVPAPLQYHLGALPEALRDACLESFERRPAARHAAARTFRDFVVEGFGERLADLFLIPQNEKTLATSLERLSASAVSRFFPPPDTERVRAGARGEPQNTGEYNAQFWYPKRGGIEALVRGLAAPLEEIRLRSRVVHVDLEERTLHTGDGASYGWDLAFSSLPLRELCRLSAHHEIAAGADVLSHSATLVFNIGIRGPLAPALRDAHWVYVPDPALPFYRVGVYSNISRGLCPPGCAALYAEVAAPGDAPLRLAQLQPRVIEALAQLGWVDPSAILCVSSNAIPCAYVHQTPEAEQFAPWAKQVLRSHGVIPIGRYGLWGYTSMEDSIHSAIDAVEKAL